MNSELTQIRTLKNPPINEAIIEVRIAPEGDPVKQDELFKLSEQFENQLPVRKTRRNRNINVEESTVPGEEGDKKIIQTDSFFGYLLCSKDELDRVQFGKRVFSVHRVRPYLNWELLLSKFQSFWPAYREVVGDSRIVRLGVRFVNEFDIPIAEDGNTLEKHFSAHPMIPPRWPKVMSDYSAQFTLHDQPNSVQVSQFWSDNRNGRFGVSLDIDAFAVVDMKPVDSEIIERLNDLRDLKNRIFFDSFTEETVKLFEAE